MIKNEGTHLKKKYRMNSILFILFIFPQPEVLDQIQNLRELWMDSNSLQIMPGV